MPPKNQEKSSSETFGQKSSKKIGASADPWPQDLKTQHFDQFPTSINNNNNNNSIKEMINEIVANFIKADLPEQRTQLLAKLGEVLTKSLAANENGSSDDDILPLHISLIRNILLPILFDSRVRYLHKAVMNMIKSRYSSSSSSINIENEISNAFANFLNQHNDGTKKVRNHWLQLTNDIDCISILIMPIFPNAFSTLCGSLLQTLDGITRCLILPLIVSRNNGSEDNVSSENENKMVLTESQLAELRFACRVVTTLFHKFSKIISENIFGAFSNDNNNHNKKIFANHCKFLTAVNAEMLSSTGSVFPKDLLNSAGLLVATTLELCASSFSSSLQVIDAAMKSITIAQNAFDKDENSISAREQIAERLLLLQSPTTSSDENANLIESSMNQLLQNISINGAFALARGILSHYAGLKNADLILSSSSSSSSSSTSFISKCFNFSSWWANCVDEPEARFSALQTLDSITRYYQEAVFNQKSSSNNSSNLMVVDEKNNNHFDEISHVLDQISETLLAVWDDPTMNVTGPLFDTFDRIIQCKTTLMQKKRSNLSQDGANQQPSFLSETMVKLLSDQQHDRRGKWQVISCLIPRMSFEEIADAVHRADVAVNNNNKIIVPSSSSSSFEKYQSIASFLIPILCKCAVSSKCSSRGDVLVSLSEQMAKQFSENNKDKNQEALSQKKQDFFKEILFAPMVSECLKEFKAKDVSLVTEAVASTCSNNNNGGGGLMSLLPSASSSYTSKFFINSVITHLVTPLFRSSAKILDGGLILAAMVDAIQNNTNNNNSNDDQVKIPLQWLFVFLAWRAKGCDLEILKMLSSNSSSQLVKQHLLEALNSSESDVRIAAVDVLILPHKSIANQCISQEQFEIAFDFFEANWVTGEPTFRNTLTTLMKKFLARIVETAKHSRWKEEIADFNNNNTRNNNTDKQNSIISSWQTYIVDCLDFLVSKFMSRIISTTDTTDFSSDRAMANVVALQEVQDCILQFISDDNRVFNESNNNNNNNSKKKNNNFSVIAEFRNVVGQNSHSVNFSSLVKNRWKHDNNNNNQLDAVQKLFGLLNNAWTALRNTSLNFLTKCLAITSTSSFFGCEEFIPVRFASIQEFLFPSTKSQGNNQEIFSAIDLVLSASTIRSSAFGVAVLHLIVEAIAKKMESENVVHQDASATLSSSSSSIKLGDNFTFDYSPASSSFRSSFADFICDNVANKLISTIENSSRDNNSMKFHLGNTPIHGILATVGTIVPLVLSSQETQNSLNNDQLLEKSISVILRGLNIAATYVGSHSNDVAAENSSNNNNLKVDCRGHIIVSENNESVDNANTSSAITAKDSRKIVNNAWLAVNLGTQALEKIIAKTQLYSNNNNNTKQVLLSPAQAKSISQTLLKLLLESKHNGVISKTRESLRYLMHGLFRVQAQPQNQQHQVHDDIEAATTSSSSSSFDHQLRQIPSDTLSLLLTSDDGVRSKESGRMLRRSQGLPHAIAPILESEDHNIQPVLLQRTMKFLLDTSLQAATTQFDAASVKAMEEIKLKDEILIHGVNSLNVLKFIFEDSQLGALARPWVEPAFVVALKGFESPDWFFRNSSLMLFTAVAKRAMGDQAALISRTVGTVRVSNCATTLSDLFLRLPKALPAMIRSLAPLVEDNNSNKDSSSASHSTSAAAVHNPNIFPILFVLSMLKPNNNNNNQQQNNENENPLQNLLRRAVTSCLLSNSLPARCTAASALISVSSTESISSGQYILDALSVANQNVLLSWDSLHGLATLVTRSVDILINDSNQNNNNNANHDQISGRLTQTIRSTAATILEFCLNSNHVVPSGVWSVLMRMATTLRNSSILDNNLNSLIQKMFEFVVIEKLVSGYLNINNNDQEQEGRNQFCRTIADDFFENCHFESLLETSAKLRQLVSNSVMIQQRFCTVESLGLPISRLCRAAIQNSLIPTSASATINMKAVSKIALAFLKNLLPQYSSLPLWKRIHASDALLSSIGFFTLQLSQNQNMNNIPTRELENVILATASSVLPPTVLCAFTLLKTALLTKTKSNQHQQENLQALQNQLLQMSHASQPTEFRVTAARCVFLVLASSSWLDGTQLVVKKAALQLAFDDDISVRRTVSGTESTPYLIQKLMSSLAHEKQQVKDQIMKDIISVFRESATTTVTEEQEVNQEADDDDHDEDEEEDLFAKDEDNAYAEVGIIRELFSEKIKK